MRIIENSRQIPKTKEYMISSHYYDTLYGYLQMMSHWDGIKGHSRYVYKKSINYSRMAEDLNLSRQTVSKRFNSMLEGTKQQENSDIPPLIRLSEDGLRYELIALESNLAMLVPQTTLEVLVSALNDNAISVYVYLFNRYFANGFNKFKFSYPELKNAIGIAANSNGNNYIISSILFVLSKIGLLSYNKENKIDEEGRSICQHTITWMTNEIEDLPEVIQNQNIDKKRWSLYSKVTGKKRTQTAC